MRLAGWIGWIALWPLAGCDGGGNGSFDAAVVDAAVVDAAATADAVNPCAGCPTVVIDGRQYTLGDLIIIPLGPDVFTIWNVEDTCETFLTEPDPPAVPFPGEDLFILSAGAVPIEGTLMGTGANISIDDGFQVRRFHNQRNPADWITVTPTTDGPLVEFRFTIQFELDPDTSEVIDTFADPLIIEESMLAAPCF